MHNLCRKQAGAQNLQNQRGHQINLDLQLNQKKKKDVTKDRKLRRKLNQQPPPEDLRIPATNDWISMSAHKRMGLPDEEDIATIHMSAPPLMDQVPKTFVCTKMICHPNCVHCYSEKLTEAMRL